MAEEQIEIASAPYTGGDWEAHGLNVLAVGLAGNTLIAVASQRDAVHPDLSVEGRANAKLMAAAPRLLRALQGWIAAEEALRAITRPAIERGIQTDEELTAAEQEAVGLAMADLVIAEEKAREAVAYAIQTS